MINRFNASQSENGDRQVQPGINQRMVRHEVMDCKNLLSGTALWYFPTLIVISSNAAFIAARKGGMSLSSDLLGLLSML
jgi:hypothetical protein